MQRKDGCDNSNVMWKEYYEAQAKLKESLHMKVIELKQMAKEKWLTEGDECAKFFTLKCQLGKIQTATCKFMIRMVVTALICLSLRKMPYSTFTICTMGILK